MKKYLKNIIKSIAYTALISIIVLSINGGIYMYMYSKAIENNELKLIYSYNEIKDKIDIDEENGEEETYELFMNPSGFIVYYNIYQFKLVVSMLIVSIIIGSIIGFIVSINENSNKKVLITYILTIPAIILLLELNEKVQDGCWIELYNLWDRSFKIIGFYTLGFAGIIIGKRFINKRKVKYINEELK